MGLGWGKLWLLFSLSLSPGGLEERVNQFYQGSTHLTFEAELTRTVKGQDVTRYLARVTMTPGKVCTQVYDRDAPYQLIAEVIGMIAPGQELAKEKRLNNPKADTCLFGTLGVPWIGPLEIADPPYTDRIRAGHFAGFTSIRGQLCYLIQYDHFVYDKDPLFPVEKIVQTYQIALDTFSLVEWDSFHYDLNDPSGESVMTVTRKYRQLEPTLVSARTGEKP